MVTDLAMRLRHAIRELMQRHEVTDMDNFCGRLAVAIDGELRSGTEASRALSRSMQATKTSTFTGRSRGGGTKRAFTRELEKVLASTLGAATVTQSITEVLLKFARYCESQLTRDLKANPDESFARSQLQTWLARHGMTARESHEGAGQVDLTYDHRGDGTRDAIEVKVPRSKTAFDDGITEVAQYAESMRVREAYYVAFDHCSDLSSPRFMQQELTVVERDGITIRCIRIRVPATPPSKVGAKRRKSASGVADVPSG